MLVYLLYVNIVKITAPGETVYFIHLQFTVRMRINIIASYT